MATEYAKKAARKHKKYKQEQFRRKASDRKSDEQARDNSYDRKQTEGNTAIQQANEKANARNVFNIVASLIFAVTLGSFVLRMSETDDFGADASVYHLQFVIYVLSLLFWGLIKFSEGFRGKLSWCLCREVSKDNSWKYNRVRSALFNVVGIIFSWTLKFTSTRFTTVNGLSWAIASLILQVFLFMASIYDWILPCCYDHCGDLCKRDELYSNTTYPAADITKQQSGAVESIHLQFGSESETPLDSGHNQGKKIYDEYKETKQNEQKTPGV